MVVVMEASRVVLVVIRDKKKMENKIRIKSVP